MNSPFQSPTDTTDRRAILIIAVACLIGALIGGIAGYRVDGWLGALVGAWGCGMFSCVATGLSLPDLAEDRA